MPVHHRAMARAIPRLLLGCALLLLLPTLAMAAGDGEHGGGHGGVNLHDLLRSSEFWGSVINFSLLVFLIVKKGGKPFGAYMRNRREEMERAIHEAAEMKAKAEARYKEYNERIAGLDRELKKLKEDIARAAQEDKQKIMASAEEAARRLKAETETLIEQHAQALGHSVRREVVQAAMRAAEELLVKQISAADQQRLADDFKQRVAQNAAGEQR